MNRIKFQKREQRVFLDQVIRNLDSPSLRNLLSFGISTNYSSLKNYYTERRFLPENLFEELCLLSKINKEVLNYEIKKSSWGQQKGGKISKRVKVLNSKTILNS
jgi:hypothetical protein